MACFECGNCKTDEPLYYCTAKNEFIIRNDAGQVKIRDRKWKKGDPEYEMRRRKIRQDKHELREIV